MQGNREELKFFRRGHDFDWLANTAPAPIKFMVGDQAFYVPSSEHIFQAMKFYVMGATTHNQQSRDTAINHATTILKNNNIGGDIQKLGGQRIAGTNANHWDSTCFGDIGGLAAQLTNIYNEKHQNYHSGKKHFNEASDITVKEMVMCNVLLIKYTQNPSILKSALKEYKKGSKFVENTDDRKDKKEVDTFWGNGKRNVDDLEGRNALGVAHMVVLEYLKRELEQNEQVPVFDSIDPSIAELAGIEQTFPNRDQSQTLSKDDIDTSTKMSKATAQTRRGAGTFTNSLESLIEKQPENLGWKAMDQDQRNSKVAEVNDGMAKYASEKKWKSIKTGLTYTTLACTALAAGVCVVLYRDNIANSITNLVKACGKMVADLAKGAGKGIGE